MTPLALAGLLIRSVAVWPAAAPMCEGLLVCAGDRCEVTVTAECRMELRDCLDTAVVYVGESEEPITVLGCSNEAHPSIVVLDADETRQALSPDFYGSR